MTDGTPTFQVDIVDCWRRDLLSKDIDIPCQTQSKLENNKGLEMINLYSDGDETVANKKSTRQFSH